VEVSDLAYHTRYPLARDALLEALCPDLAVEDARNSRRVVLHLLRRQLEPSGDGEPGALLIAERCTLRLNPAAFATDVAEFAATLRVDSGNCGACGQTCGGVCNKGICTCPGGQTCFDGFCVNGTCVCQGLQTLCSGFCVDTKTDRHNCGACGHACNNLSQNCVNGACQ
jgi:hypothetical protein